MKGTQTSKSVRRTGVRACVPRIASWISRMLSEKDGTPSTKRMCFFVAINAAVGLCLGLYLRHGMEALAVDLMKWTLTAAGAAYAITRRAEYGDGGSTPPTPPAQ